MPNCGRCGQRSLATTMSMFSTEEICINCKVEERGAPSYEAARKAEETAVRSGDYNFPGVGMTPEDRAYLAARRAERLTVQG